MALVYTPEAEIGSSCPEFDLPSVDGKRYSNKDFSEASALAIVFICNHCPYVIAIEDRLIELSKEMRAQGVQFVGICSNDPSDYPEDAVPELKKRWEAKNYDFPYLYDETQEVARKFGAVCTPDYFVFDSNQNLAYRGRLDDSWKDAAKVTRQELKEALENIVSGQPVSKEQTPSMGCSIKWLSV